jgi:hypothetical protein
MRDLRELEINAFLAQAETLAQLTAHPAWAAWSLLLTDMRKSVVEELVAATDPGEIRFLQGAASTLGEILSRPARIIASAADYQAAEQADKGVVRPELRAVVGMGVDESGDV